MTTESIAAKVLNERIEYLSSLIQGRLKDLEANDRQARSIRAVLHEHTRERDELIAAVIKLDEIPSQFTPSFPDGLSGQLTRPSMARAGADT